ncbi:hypothetical protein [Arthrobacter bambusae]|uniref:hypothetical protein n=1 Tax=Arthrobacter bambusae TaxID=1338426 RepID=UPI002780ABEE|nr:hypothetical protein [Arthrobacter bambusae]MDQ0030147.1 hypothetical protein [Arthrobacter bambusae]MDQ0097830.1 hypothetical protein [Arthrobacter bambusae]
MNIMLVGSGEVLHHAVDMINLTKKLSGLMHDLPQKIADSIGEEELERLSIEDVKPLIVPKALEAIEAIEAILNQMHAVHKVLTNAMRQDLGLPKIKFDALNVVGSLPLTGGE